MVKGNTVCDVGNKFLLQRITLCKSPFHTTAPIISEFKATALNLSGGNKRTPNIFNSVLALVNYISVARAPSALYGAGITSQLCASSYWVQMCRAIERKWIHRMKQPEAVCSCVDSRRKDVHNPAWAEEGLGGRPLVAAWQGRWVPSISTATHRAAQSIAMGSGWQTQSVHSTRDRVCTTGTVMGWVPGWIVLSSQFREGKNNSARKTLWKILQTFETLLIIFYICISDFPGVIVIPIL